MKIKNLIMGLSFLFLACQTTPPADLTANAVIPSQKLITYQQMELIGFIHFTVNTFTDMNGATETKALEFLIPLP